MGRCAKCGVLVLACSTSGSWYASRSSHLHWRCARRLFSFFQAAWGSDALGVLRDSLRGLVPFRLYRKNLVTARLSSPAADVSSTSHRPVTLFGRFVFSNARLGLAKHDVPTAPPRMLHTGEDTPWRVLGAFRLPSSR